MSTEKIMEQAQVFASAWSVVGGPFDGGDAMEVATQEKDELRRMVAELVEERDALAAKLAELEGQEPTAWMNAKRDMASFIHFHEDDLPLFARPVPVEPVNVDFGMRGENMFFQIGNQSFLLDYKPEEPGEFEFMKAMLLSAFSRITHGVKTESQPVNARILDALKRAKDVAWAFEGKGSEMSAVSFLCVGGPLDGQYRAIPEGRIPFFRVAAIPNLNLLSSGAGRSVDCRIVDSVEYQLGWSEDHCRLVFRSNT